MHCGPFNGLWWPRDQEIEKLPSTDTNAANLPIEEELNGFVCLDKNRTMDQFEVCVRSATPSFAPYALKLSQFYNPFTQFLP